MPLGRSEIRTCPTGVGIDRVNESEPVALEYAPITRGSWLLRLPVGDSPAGTRLTILRIDGLAINLLRVRIEYPMLFSSSRVKRENAVHRCAVVQHLVCVNGCDLKGRLTLFEITRMVSPRRT